MSVERIEEAQHAFERGLTVLESLGEAGKGTNLRNAHMVCWNGLCEVIRRQGDTNSLDSTASKYLERLKEWRKSDSDVNLLLTQLQVLALRCAARLANGHKAQAEADLADAETGVAELQRLDPHSDQTKAIEGWLVDLKRSVRSQEGR